MKSKTVDRLLNNTPKDVEIFVDWYADLVVRINELLRENNINKKELAEKLGKKPSEISRWFSGDHNFTLRSLAKLSAELGEPLLVVPERKASRRKYGYKVNIKPNIEEKKKQDNNVIFRKSDSQLQGDYL
jgi:transcriptional regulator with XRE-family HTH domain